MSLYPSISSNVVKTVEYVEEGTTPGVFGNLPSSPAMKWIGVDMQYDDSADMKQILLRNLGSEDLAYVLQGEQMFEVSLDYAMQNSTFLKYLVNAQGGGSGSIDASLSLGIAPKINNVTNYLIASGCRPDSGSIKWTLGKEIRVSMKLLAQSIAAYTSTAPSGITWASDPGTNPWKWTDPGASGVTIAGSSYDFTSITVNVNRNLAKIFTIGNGQLQYLPPTVRDITGDITIMFENTGNYGAMLFNTPMTFVLPLKAGTSTLTLSNTFFQKQSKSIKVGKGDSAIIYEKYTWVAESGTVT
jgi:hypothetical protein